MVVDGGAVWETKFFECSFGRFCGRRLFRGEIFSVSDCVGNIVRKWVGVCLWDYLQTAAHYSPGFVNGCAAMGLIRGCAL